MSEMVGNRGQAAYAAASTFLDDFARLRASNNLPGTSIDLGVVSEIGYLAEKPELQARLDAMTRCDANLTEQDVLALVKLAILGKIDESANHQCATGISFDSYNSDSIGAFWTGKARFSHLRRAAISRNADAAPNGGSTSVTPKRALKLATRLQDALAIVTDALIHKLSRTLIIPAEEISAEKAVVTLGLDSLVAVEVRSWIKREFEAMVTTMELMTMASIEKLAGEVVRRSKVCERFKEEGTEGTDG